MVSHSLTNCREVPHTGAPGCWRRVLRDRPVAGTAAQARSCGPSPWGDLRVPQLI